MDAARKEKTFVYVEGVSGLTRRCARKKTLLQLLNFVNAKSAEVFLEAYCDMLGLCKEHSAW